MAGLLRIDYEYGRRMCLDRLKEELQEYVMTKADLSREVDDAELLELIGGVVKDKSKCCYLRAIEKKRLERDIFNSLRRLDVLQDLLDDSSVTEIMVNGSDQIFLEREGRIEKCNKSFKSRKKLEDIVQMIASGSNRIVNESTPIVDARLEDGSRVNIVLPPVALNGPVITIRKFPKETMTMERLIEIGSLTEQVAEFLKKLVISGYNIFVSGGTGSGKTTFLNALTNYIPPEERIITIEDSAELQIKNVENVVRLEARNANVEGKNAVTIRELIRSALRMRPDFLIVGEVRDAACIDMLQSMNTGHKGMSTGHSNSTKDMLSRLETMVLLGADIPLLAVRKQIASALDFIVHLGRVRDKTRKVLEIAEILDCVNGEIALNPLFVFQEEREEQGGKIVGSLVPCNNKMVHIKKLLSAGLEEKEVDFGKNSV